MKYGDPEYQRRLNLINMIPSNKFDKENFNNLSEDAMNDFNEKHLRDLRDQVMGYDEEELAVVADAITERGWTFAYNAVGEYFKKLTKKMDTIREINQ